MRVTADQLVLILTDGEAFQEVVYVAAALRDADAEQAAREFEVLATGELLI
jgi:hypothetical protein